MKFMTITFLLIIALMLPSAGCSSGGNSPAPAPSINSTITDGTMTTSVDKSSKPTGGTKTSFPADTPVIYCCFKVNGVVQEDMIKATWIYLGGASPDKANTQINETYDIVQVKDSSYNLAFYLDKPDTGWYKGDYKVVLSINNREKLSIPFKIQ